jgi:hypothetical protein
MIYIKLKGTTDLLMHNPTSMRQAGKGLSRKQIPTPEEEAAAARYLLEDGKFCVPSVAVRNCILNGAKGFKIGKTAAWQVLSGAITIEDEWFPLLDEKWEPMPGDKYTVDIRRAVVQRQGILRARPRIASWGVVAWFGFNEEAASLDQVKGVLINAGSYVGLLDYRPEKKGWFGKFTVEDIWLE